MLFATEGYDEYVAQTGVTIIERHNGGHPVRNMEIVDKGRIEWGRKRELCQMLSIAIHDCRLAALDVVTVDEHHRDKVDAVTVDAFRRRFASSFNCLDAKLMHLDMPGMFWLQCTECLGGNLQDGLHHRIGEGLGKNRLEMTLDTAVQMVVVRRLIMWLMFFNHDSPSLWQGRQRRVTA